MELLKPSLANSSPATPLGFLDRAAVVYGDSPSVLFNDSSYTWSETHRRCLKVASSINDLGLGRGLRSSPVVSVVSPNTPAMYELQFSVPMSGAVLNNVNYRLDARTMSVLLQHSESKLVFVDYALEALVLDAISLFPENTPRPPVVLVREGEVGPEEPVPCGSSFLSYTELLERGDPGFEWVGPRFGSDPMVLNYTSGTTSSPKGVVHCHEGIFGITMNCLVDWSVPKQPVYLWTLPIFHANGWSYPYGIAAVGGANVCVRRFDADVIYSLIERHGVTHMCGAPVVLNMLSNNSNNNNNKPMDRRVHVMTAGAPPPAAVLLRAEAMGFVVSHGYGLTETAGPVVSCAWKSEWDKHSDAERARLKSRQGVPMVGFTAMDVVDSETGESVKRDGTTVGEVVLKGGSVMLGYFKDPVETAKCMRHGWFYTGDVGVMHPDGYLEVKDRSKDVIISGGENISSVEVESVLYSHPAVNEAAVVGRLDEFWGESPCAFVSLKGDSPQKPTEEDIVEYCRSKLPHFMAPKTVVFEEDLPKTSTGKIQKFMLREVAKGMGPVTIPKSCH